MKIKRMFISLSIIFLIIATLIIIISNTKHIWKLFGYIFCENPNNIVIHSVIKDYARQTVRIKGIIKTKDKYYTSHTYNTQNDKLIIGMKFNRFWGYETKEQNFEIEIKCNVSQIKSIHIKDNIDEIKIWPMEGI